MLTIEELQTLLTLCLNYRATSLHEKRDSVWNRFDKVVEMYIKDMHSDKRTIQQLPGIERKIKLMMQIQGSG